MAKTHIYQELVSVPVTTPDSVSSTSFVTPSGSPGMVVVPKTDGLWKVTVALPLDMSPSNSSFSRVFNTSGGATLVAFSNGYEFGTPGGSICNPEAYAIYKLTAGVTYVFDYQVCVTGGTVVVVPNDPHCPTAMTAHRL